MDPYSDRDLGRLREAIRGSQSSLQDLCSQYRARLRLYAGDGYGDVANEEDTPFNVFNLALRIYKRRLISGTPKVLVTSRTKQARMQAYELSLAADQVVREINLEKTIKEVITQGLMSVGIVKVGVTIKEMEEAGGILHDAEQPYVDPILLEDFAYDTQAKSWEEIDWAANRYQVPEEYLESDQFASGDDNAKGELSAKDEDVRSGGDDTVRDLAMGNQSLGKDEFRRYVTLWDVWLPKERLMLTLRDSSGPPLRVVPWEGPEKGPYHLLCFDPIPGNIMPSAPAGHLEHLAKLLNRMFRKLGDQADRQKTIPLVTATAASQGISSAIQDASDGQAVQCDDPQSVKELRLGGIDQQSFSFFAAGRDLFSWLAGNIDTLGGLGSKADTLGQEKLLAESGSTLVTEMDTVCLQFLKEVLTDLCWYIYSDPTGMRDLVKKVDGTDIEIPFNYSPERRDQPWYLFNFDVNPYSVHVRSPSERLQSILTLFQQLIAPMLPMMPQWGLQFDMEQFWRIVTRYSGQDELGDLIKAFGQSIDGAPTSGDQGPMKSPFSQREYVRTNRGSGAAEDPMGQQLMAQMMASANQGAA